MIDYELNKIKAIVFDVDGVLSSSTVAMDSEGYPVRTLNIKDGYAIQLAVKLGIKVAIMTGGRNEEIRKRYANLGVHDVFLNCAVKLNTWDAYLKTNNLQAEDVIYVGDDIPDYEIMQRAGCQCCPKDACADIKAISTYISDYDGGMGVARDVIEQVLRAQGKWLKSAKAFGW